MVPMLTVASMMVMYFCYSGEKKVQTAYLFLAVGLIMIREKFLREIRKEYTVKEYIGIAADEGYRLEQKQNRQPSHVHLLVEWGMTEADCLKYCYDHGYDWNGLYGQFKRVSCWCCPLQPLPELRQLFYHHPDLWQKLKNWDKRTWRKFHADYSVEELEVRFLLSV